MNIDKIKKIIQLLESHGLSKISIKDEKEEILVEKTPVAAPSPHQVIPAVLEDNTKATNQEERGRYIESPMVGTFYSSPAPDQPTFVKVGDRVEKDTIVCIIEAMKVMNEVKANTSGVIKEILIENGKPVEFGTHLFVIG